MRTSQAFALMVSTALFIGLAGTARAESPLQLALFNPMQLVDEEKSVLGLRLNFLYGVNDNVSGLDVGMVNRTSHYQKGIQLGLFNSTFDFAGIQVGVINKTQWLNGLQLGLINIASMEDQRFMPLCNFAF